MSYGTRLAHTTCGKRRLPPPRLQGDPHRLMAVAVEKRSLVWWYLTRRGGSWRVHSDDGGGRDGGGGGRFGGGPLERPICRCNITRPPTPTRSPAVTVRGTPVRPTAIRVPNANPVAAALCPLMKEDITSPRAPSDRAGPSSAHAAPPRPPLARVARRITTRPCGTPTRARGTNPLRARVPQQFCPSTSRANMVEELRRTQAQMDPQVPGPSEHSTRCR